MSDSAKRKSIFHLSEEELRTGEWRNDLELVAQYKKLRELLVEGIADAIDEMSEEDREALKERLEDGTYQYGQDIIRVEGEM